METMVFIRNYEDYLNILEKIVKPEYQGVIEEMREIDPHELITPDTYFNSGQESFGLVVGLLVNKINKL
jgi:hypothetical protein